MYIYIYIYVCIYIYIYHLYKDIFFLFINEITTAGAKMKEISLG